MRPYTIYNIVGNLSVFHSDINLNTLNFPKQYVLLTITYAVIYIIFQILRYLICTLKKPELFIFIHHWFAIGITTKSMHVSRSSLSLNMEYLSIYILKTFIPRFSFIFDVTKQGRTQDFIQGGASF